MDITLLAIKCMCMLTNWSNTEKTDREIANIWIINTYSTNMSLVSSLPYPPNPLFQTFTILFQTLLSSQRKQKPSCPLLFRGAGSCQM